MIDQRRSLPSTQKLIQSAERTGLVDAYGVELVTVQAQALLASLRSDPTLVPEQTDIGWLVVELEGRLLACRGKPIQRVINATGIFLHTNLGRAPLPKTVVEELAPLLDAGCDLEVDLASGRRGDRNLRANELLRALTGAEASLVVNNNAAALVLVLSTFARGKQVVVSRGELVEIGGSFRVPDILESAGCELKEVGTTNRTRLADYAEALSEQTALLLKVNPSNYTISGFTEEVSPKALAELAAEKGVPLLIDEGSGLLRDRPEGVFDGHQSISSLLKDGCDLVCGSGDKVLGGTQAGLLLGRAELVERCRRSPLYRALRPSRLTLVTLCRVLDLHLRGQSLPLDQLFVDLQEHRLRLERAAENWKSRWAGLGERDGTAMPAVEIVESPAFVGGGSAPERKVRGEVLAFAVGSSMAESLRSAPTPVLARMNEGRLLVDLRTVSASDETALFDSLFGALGAPVEGEASGAPVRGEALGTPGKSEARRGSGERGAQ